jgi:WD40 repeat protein
MNLELLDPFSRHVPDRVDATLQLADLLHRPAALRESVAPAAALAAAAAATAHGGEAAASSSLLNQNTSFKDLNGVGVGVGLAGGDDSDDDDAFFRAAYTVAYNRRGTYLAVGHASGTVAVHCTLSRTLAALYNPPPVPASSSSATTTTTTASNSDASSAVTSLSWARRSRALLVGSSCGSSGGSTTTTLVRLYDTTHPLGPEEASAGLYVISGTRMMAANYYAVEDDGMEGTTTSGGGGGGGGIDGGGTANRASLSPAMDRTTTTTTTAPSSSSLPLRQQPTMTTTTTTTTDHEVPPTHLLAQTHHTPFCNVHDPHCIHLRELRRIGTHTVPLGSKVITGVKRKKEELAAAAAAAAAEAVSTNVPSAAIAAIAAATSLPAPIVSKYAGVSFELPHSLSTKNGGNGGSSSSSSMQINPCRPNAGWAVLADGTLCLFWVPVNAMVHTTDPTVLAREPRAVLVPLDGTTTTTTTETTTNNTTSSTTTIITTLAASFDPRGQRLYAVQKRGQSAVSHLVGYHVEPIWKALSLAVHKSKRLPLCEPKFQWTLSGKSGNNNTSESGGGGSSLAATIWHLVVSRNGKYLILNASDGSIRLYRTNDCWEEGSAATHRELDKKPLFVFTDLVSKVKFAACDFSGDAEYVVGGANMSNDNKYELYIWNTSTGLLMDKLTGASTKLHSVAWHPTRSFLAVACSDGLVDVWGPRINWTAFAPDFQALPMNVEYIEREDEFDLPVHAVEQAGSDQAKAISTAVGSGGGGLESVIVDVTTITPVPVFASDSEREEDVFVFETRVKNLLAGRAERASRKSGVGVDD